MFIAGSFVAFQVSGLPIAFVLAATAMVHIAVSANTVLFPSYPRQIFNGLEDYSRLALPLYILLGEFINGGVLGHQAMAIAWLANKLAPFDITLEPGHMMLSGSFTRPVWANEGDTLHADFGPLGSVAVQFV